MSFDAQQGLVDYNFSKRQMVEWPADLCDPEYSRQVIGKLYYFNNCIWDFGNQF
jgi:hypothetical protein